MSLLVTIIVMIALLIGIGILRLKTIKPKNPQEEAQEILRRLPHDYR